MKNRTEDRLIQNLTVMHSAEIPFFSHFQIFHFNLNEISIDMNHQTYLPKIWLTIIRFPFFVHLSERKIKYKRPKMY